MTTLNPYLNFDGNCKAAMTFYKDALGGKLELQTVGQSPMAEQMPGAKKDAIFHSTLTANNMVIMASDMGWGEFNNGNAYHICVDCSTEDEINSFFKKLSVGGTVTQKVAPMPWGAIFGSFVDKFGKQWILNQTKK